MVSVYGLSACAEQTLECRRVTFDLKAALAHRDDELTWVVEHTVEGPRVGANDEFGSCVFAGLNLENAVDDARRPNAFVEYEMDRWPSASTIWTDGLSEGEEHRGRS